MKKLLIVLAALALITSVGMMKAEADPTDNITITVTVKKLSVLVTTDGSWALTTVDAGSTTTMADADKELVQNDGNIAETFTLQLTGTGAWTASTDQTVGSNEFVMNAVFSATTDIGIVEGSLGTEDIVLSGSATPATATVYGTAAATKNGLLVPKTESRALWLQFKAPNPETTAAEQSLTLTIGISA